MKGQIGVMGNNIKFSRKELYEEIWDMSLRHTAIKHNIKPTELKQFCFDNEIPTPSSGYFTRRNWGFDVTNEKTPLPEADNDEIIFVPKTKKPKSAATIDEKRKDEIIETKKVIPVSQEENIQIGTEESTKDKYADKLLFLDEGYRQKVIEEISNIQIRVNKRLHYRITEYRDDIKQYKKDLRESQRSSMLYPYGRDPNIEKPLYYDDISTASLPRMEKILDALFFSAEKLDCRVNYDFTISKGEDTISLSFSESKSKVPHELTKEEAAQLVKYEDEKRNGHYPSRPKINKYDYYFNDKLSIKIGLNTFRDSVNEKLEDMLDKMMIAIFESIESERKTREASEEAERLRLEEERRKEEIRKRKNLEIERTQQLVNESEDYIIASQIRQYVQAVINLGNLTEETTEWINWANKKADWFDPSIKREDEYLGIRDHKESSEKKALKPKDYPYYRW
ncbi:MAG: hypothetical protein ACLUFN_03310 [Eubacterium sp.]